MLYLNSFQFQPSLSSCSDIINPNKVAQLHLDFPSPLCLRIKVKLWYLFFLLKSRLNMIQNYLSKVHTRNKNVGKHFNWRRSMVKSFFLSSSIEETKKEIKCFAFYNWGCNFVVAWECGVKIKGSIKNDVTQIKINKSTLNLILYPELPGTFILIHSSLEL